MRRVLGFIALCGAVVVAVFLSRSPHNARHRSSVDEDAPLIVSTVTVQPSLWEKRIKAFGQVRAVQGVDLSAEVSGIVDKIYFESDTDVKAGTVLLRLRPNDDEAKLATLQASVDLWDANTARDSRQFALQAVSRATLDMDNANLRSFRAQVRAQRALIAEKTVSAPFAGRLGIRLVDPGQYLVAGTPIASLQSMDPIYVDFNVPEQQSGRISPDEPVEVTVAAYPGRIFKAAVVARDSRLNTSSRMLSVRARLGNADHALVPGMFATISVPDGASKSMLSVPLTAISYSPYGDYVYVLTPPDPVKHVRTARLRAVRPGDKQGDRVCVVGGLAAGDTVVTAGQVKLRDGSVVQVDNSVQPASELEPQPVEE